uniref:Uncharacterized protein n=1 Tax=Lactuca sativa TaxID=4236 RepID=A0A9R1UD93_LACSA|nr:hypothetical protein LSAT_V11C900495110 [Lactuca sativa]
MTLAKLILNSGMLLNSRLGVGLKLFSGLTTSLGNHFASIFPHLYILDPIKACFVFGFLLELDKNPCQPIELLELDQICIILDNVKLSNVVSRYVIDSKLICGVNNPTIWLNVLPLKDTYFTLSACLDRILSVTALTRRGVFISSSSCHICSLAPTLAIIFLLAVLMTMRLFFGSLNGVTFTFKASYRLKRPLSLLPIGVVALKRE